MYEKHRRAKATLIEQFGGRCQSCGYDRSHRALQLHHIEPKNQTRSAVENVAEATAHPERFRLLCANCHFEEHERLDRARQIMLMCPVCGAAFPQNNANRGKGGANGTYCSARCFQRARRAKATDPERILARIRAKVRVEGDCWVWEGDTLKGSPVIAITDDSSFAGRTGRPHPVRRVVARLTWPEAELPKKLKPPSCGNILCVRPEHIVH